MLGYSCVTCGGLHSFVQCTFFSFIHRASEAVACAMIHSSVRLCVCEI